MKTASAMLVPIDLKTGKISGSSIDVTRMIKRRKPLSYGKVKYKAEWVK